MDAGRPVRRTESHALKGLPEDLGEVDVEEFLRGLGIDNVRPEGRGEVRYSCPFEGHAHGDRNASATMNRETTVFHCFGCKRSGNAVSFLMEHMGVGPFVAVRWIRERWGTGPVDVEDGKVLDRIRGVLDASSSQTGENERRNRKLSDIPVHSFGVDWSAVGKAMSSGEDVGSALSYLLRRGLSTDTLASWEIGFDLLSQRLAIPVRDEDGDLVGFKGRAWWEDAQVKYAVLGDREGEPAQYGFGTYEVGLVVFGLDRARDAQALVVCEGELNAIALTQSGVEGAVALGTSWMTGAQELLIRSQGKPVVLFVDPDEAGRRMLRGYENSKGERVPGVVERLNAWVPVSVVSGHAVDPMEMSGNEARRLVLDASSWARTFVSPSR